MIGKILVKCVGLLAAIIAFWMFLLLAFLYLDPRFIRLQKLGEVPVGAKREEWRIAERTSWWGDSIDPEEFWKGRVIWNDHFATDAANRRGRGYPPIPTHVTNLIIGFPLSSRSHADIRPGWLSGGLDGGRMAQYYGSDAESAYWVWFSKTKPKPPLILEREQLQVAESIFRRRQRIINRSAGVKQYRWEHDREASAKGDAQGMGMPIEALSDEALLWAYVSKKRTDYCEAKSKDAQLQSRLKSDYDRHVNRVLGDLPVDTKLITQPLTDEQIIATKAWKIVYLQRLAKDPFNQPYIDAYLEAWKLSLNEIVAKN